MSDTSKQVTIVSQKAVQNKTQCNTEVSVVSNSGFLFKAGGAVKVFEDHFILPGHSGDVVCNMSINFL